MSFIGTSFDEAAYTTAIKFENAQDLIDEVLNTGYDSDLVIISEAGDFDAHNFLPDEVEELFEDGTFEPGVWGLCFENRGAFESELVTILSPSVLRKEFEYLKKDVELFEKALKSN
jgi:hypothetical protein